MELWYCVWHNFTIKDCLNFIVTLINHLIWHSFSTPVWLIFFSLLLLLYFYVFVHLDFVCRHILLTACTFEIIVILNNHFCWRPVQEEYARIRIVHGYCFTTYSVHAAALGGFSVVLQPQKTAQNRTYISKTAKEPHWLQSKRKVAQPSARQPQSSADKNICRTAENRAAWTARVEKWY